MRTIFFFNKGSIKLIFLFFLFSSCSDSSALILAENEIIINNDIEKSQHFYEKAFKKNANTYISSRHYINSLINYLQLGESNGVELYSKILQERGAPFSMIQYLATKNGYQLVGEEREIYEPKISSKFNLDLRKQIEDMHYLDQKYRIEENYDSIDIIDIENEKKLFNIFENYGYPSEELVGPWFNGFGIAQNKLNVIILHLIQKGNKPILEEIFLQFKSGNIGQLVFTNWASYGYTQEVVGYDQRVNCGGGQELVEVDGKLYKYKCDEKSKSQVSNFRKSLGMDSRDLFIKKLVLRRKKGYFFYENGSYIASFSIPNDKTQDSILRSILTPLDI